MTPTDEQLHIIDQVRGTNDNLIINALAGTGKTTTLEMVQNASTKQPILYLAFNKRVAEEAEKKFNSTTTVRTLNSLGHRVWAKAHSGKITLDLKKTQDLLRQLINEFPRTEQAIIWESFWDIVSGVAMAKALGYIPEGKFTHVKPLCTKGEFHASLDEEPDSTVADLIDAVLTLSIKASYEGLIDYNDQLYMPTLFGGSFPRFPLVMGDEVQDFSPINHAMLDKLVTDRLVAVGDPWQSIYAFRGAKQGGMAELTKKFSAKVCDLSVSFRCPSEIVNAVRWRVPQFKSIREGGCVRNLPRLALTEIQDDSTILCRNNAPLFSLAMRLLQTKRSVQVAGSDVGPKIVGILRKLGDVDMSKSSLLSAIEGWRAERLARQAKSAEDIADCMKVFAGFGDTLGQAISYAEHLFKQTGKIRLMTGHKAKGLEWPTVYHLDPWLCRSDEQDLNLRYVISTRAMETLYEIDSRGIH